MEGFTYLQYIIFPQIVKRNKAILLHILGTTRVITGQPIQRAHPGWGAEPPLKRKLRR